MDSSWPLWILMKELELGILSRVQFFVERSTVGWLDPSLEK